jgi:hypothetical protein
MNIRRRGRGRLIWKKSERKWEGERDKAEFGVGEFGDEKERQIREAEKDRRINKRRKRRNKCEIYEE